jgi:hypothetical protein
MVLSVRTSSTIVIRTDQAPFPRAFQDRLRNRRVKHGGFEQRGGVTRAVFDDDSDFRAATVAAINAEIGRLGDDDGIGHHLLLFDHVQQTWSVASSSIALLRTQTNNQQ